jgi:transglutaminase-like putative cysteine protease
VRYQAIHKTRYEYRHDVSVSHHIARLGPRLLPRQRCLDHALEIDPEPALVSSRVDYFGNPTTFLTVEGAHRRLVVTARSLIHVDPPELPDPAQTAPWERVREACREPIEPAAREPCEFVFPSPLVPFAMDFRAYAAGSFPAERPILEAVLDLNHRIASDFKFDPKATTVATPLEQVIQSRRGVCQDFAHFQIACLRSLGIPARYVSGYLETRPPPGQPKLIGCDASHAWTQVWLGLSGWVDVDPTNDVLPEDHHITVAWGRDYSDVCPIRGIIVGGGHHELSVAVDVLPFEPPGPSSSSTAEGPPVGENSGGNSEQSKSA